VSSFTDLLRRARSSRTTILHKFLTNYDASSPRVYAFVEGDPDVVFYRTHIRAFVENPALIFLYSCGGKPKVYEAYRNIVARLPGCTRVLFFVDKDLDDIIGQTWPTDPRIFVTEFYSIENYLVCSGLVERFFADFVTVSRIEVDLSRIIAVFDDQLRIFHGLLLSTMAWIVVMRRAGHRVMLNDISLDALCEFNDEGAKRRKGRAVVAYLSRVTQTPSPTGVWRDVRRACRELRRLPPKRYIRGKFEVWWVLKFIRRVAADLSRVAAESGGSVSVHAQLQESSFVQLLAGAVPTPAALNTFLLFHLGRRSEAPAPRTGVLRRIFRRL
jgi:hypothetical protein